MQTEQSIQHSSFVIPDLCCATEEALIRKRLGGRPDIQGLDFNIVSHRLRVRHSCPEEKILQLLKEAGLPGISEQTTGPVSRNKSHTSLLVSTGISGGLFLVGGLAGLLELADPIRAVLFLGSMSAGGWHIGLKGFKAIRALSLDMNFLMSIAAIGAVILGEYAEGAAVVLLFSVSLLLESMSIDRSRRAIQSLMKLAPLSACVVRGERERTLPIEEVVVGDHILIRPGEYIPLDGEVVSGSSSVNQAAITGESIPVEKAHGAMVYAGSLNEQGALEVRVTRTSDDSTLARIVHMVEEAQSLKAPVQTFVERFARIYTPAVFGVAILMSLLPPLLGDITFQEAVYRSLVMIVIACPCALVISTPITLVSGMTNAARHGILVKGGKHMETLARVQAIAFDKTGTLTQGKPVVTNVVALNSISPREILKIVAAAEARSEHQIADAILRKAREEGLSLSEFSPDTFSAMPGKGIRTTVGGHEFIVGNHQLVEELGLCSPDVERALFPLEREGKTVILLADEKKVLGLIALADAVRDEAARTLRELKRLGIRRSVLLSGDNKPIAEMVGSSLGFDATKAELLPAQKLREIKSLQQKYGPVAMVGDGVNDAPALAAADVGIAMGGIGSDTALETADVVLMSDNIAAIPYAVRLSRESLRIIRQNVALALGTKFLFLGLGALGLTSLWLAILADDGATLLVVLNGLRLLTLKEKSYI